MIAKDYMRLAEALKLVRPEDSVVGSSAREQWVTDVAAIGRALKTDNALFSREKFLRDCGVE